MNSPTLKQTNVFTASTFKPALLALLSGLAMPLAAQAEWIPTGKTQFAPPATVKVHYAQRFQLKAKLYYEAKDSANANKTKMIPFSGQQVDFSMMLWGYQVPMPLYPSNITDAQGSASTMFISLDSIKTQTTCTYYEDYKGGTRVINGKRVRMNPCHATGKVVIN